VSAEQTIDFVAVREDWNTYKVRNGSTLRTKVMLRGVIRTPETGMLNGQFMPLASLFPVKEDKGPPSDDQTIRPEDVLGPTAFDIVSEPVNIYDIPASRQLLFISGFLRTVNKTKKFAKDGSRIYQADFAVAVSQLPYPKREDLLKQELQASVI
jgi:hypothetical protein